MVNKYYYCKIQNSSNENQSPGTSQSIEIGAKYGGGIIAYILKSGDPGYDAAEPHGLIVTIKDQPIKPWWNGRVLVTKTSTAFGTGLSNTNKIIAIQGNGDYAAQICRNLKIGGYNDWYLPSRDELIKICANKTLIEGFEDDYWSSSENLITDDQYPGARVWTVDFNKCRQEVNSKNGYNSIRAVRSF